jgi:hypothetical protein
MEPVSLFLIGTALFYCIVILKCKIVDPQQQQPPINTNIIQIPAPVARIVVPIPNIAPQRIPTPDSIYDYQNLIFKAHETLGSGEWSVCSICLEPMLKDQIIQLLPCGHYYHDKCLTDWFIKKKTALCCPMCNHDLNSRQ